MFPVTIAYTEKNIRDPTDARLAAVQQIHISHKNISGKIDFLNLMSKAALFFSFWNFSKKGKKLFKKQKQQVILANFENFLALTEFPAPK